MSISFASVSVSRSPLEGVGVLAWFPLGVETRTEVSGETTCAAGVEPGVLYVYGRGKESFSNGNRGGNWRGGLVLTVRKVHVNVGRLDCVHTKSHAISIVSRIDL